MNTGISRFVARFLELYDMLVRWFIGKILGLMHITWPESRWKGFLTFTRFWLIGLSATVVSYVVNVIVLLSTGSLEKTYDFVIANVAAFVASVIWTFYWNNKYVFVKDKDSHRSVFRAFVKTFLVYAFTGLVLNNLLGYVWIYIARISKYTAPVLNMLIGFPVNFIMNRLWVFKSDEN